MQLVIRSICRRVGGCGETTEDSAVFQWDSYYSWPEGAEAGGNYQTLGRKSYLERHVGSGCDLQMKAAASMWSPWGEGARTINNPQIFVPFARINQNPEDKGPH